MRYGNLQVTSHQFPTQKFLILVGFKLLCRFVSQLAHGSSAAYYFSLCQLLAPYSKRHLVDDARNHPDSCATEKHASFGHVLILSLANRRHRGCDA